MSFGFLDFRTQGCASLSLFPLVLVSACRHGQVNERNVEGLHATSIRNKDRKAYLLIFQIAHRRHLRYQKVLRISTLRLRYEKGLCQGRIRRLCSVIAHNLVLCRQGTSTLTSDLLPVARYSIQNSMLHAHVLSMRLLYMMTRNELRFHIVRVGRIKVPLHVTFLHRRQNMQNRLRRVNVAFRQDRVRDFYRHYLCIIKASKRINNVFTRVSLKLNTIVAIMMILIIGRPTQVRMVIFIRRKRTRFHNGTPTLHVIHTFMRKACDTSGHGFKVLLPSDLMCRNGTLLGRFNGRVLITSTSVLRVRELKVTYLDALPTPRNTTYVTINVLCRIRRVLSVNERLFRQSTALLTMTRRFLINPLQAIINVIQIYTQVLTQRTHYRCQREFNACVFTRTRVLRMTRSTYLVVPPRVTRQLAHFRQSSETFPIVSVVGTITVDRTTTKRTSRT